MKHASTLINCQSLSHSSAEYQEPRLELEEPANVDASKPWEEPKRTDSHLAEDLT